MLLPGKKDAVCKRELGAKLANFRKKLALAIGEKKITQGEFGEMYGGYTNRTIASYELGDVEPPALLFYTLWKTGHSIDALFAEGSIADRGCATAIDLYRNSITKSLADMSDLETERALKEASGDKKSQISPVAETAPKASGKSKASHHKAGKTKKR